jgi:hypothetical protein
VRPSLFFLLLLFLLGAALVPGPLLAADEVTSEPSVGTPSTVPDAEPARAGVESPDPPPSEREINRLELAHHDLSENVEALADKIDSFFGARRIYEETSGTYIQLRGSTIYGRGGEWEFDGRVRAKFDLPNLAEKINLVIESEDADGPQEERILTGTSPTQALDEKDLAASLQYTLQAKDTWDIRLQPGLKFKWPLDPFVRLRFRWLNPLSPTWLSRVTVTPGWFNSRGWEGRTRLDFERATGRGSLFRSSSEAIWLLDDARNLTLVQAFFFSHPLSPREQFAYEAGVVGEIDPRFEDAGYFASVRYRRDIHHGWVFLELKPQVVFEREDDFEANPSIALSLEMFFGSRYVIQAVPIAPIFPDPHEPAGGS